jgi:SAM-dependent methyltransferase
MAEMTERCWEIFLEVFAALPRQGPGNRECAARALALCRDLPPAPSILDLGCGVGGQTLHLAELTDGSIVAVDNHAPWIPLLEEAIAKHGLTDRIRPANEDMTSLPFEPESFDLIWSEGALYCIGIEPALRICQRLLRAGGYLAFTDAVWKKTNPPTEVMAMFDRDYPEMGWAEEILTKINRCDFDLVGHFTLPDDAWWDDFYTPMEACANSLRQKYAEDGQALESLALVVEEIELHRQHSDYYAYEFFVARKPAR